MTIAGPETLVADCLLGRYELLMPVATGGMAVVWAARLKGSRGFTKTVAIKTMRPELSEDPQFEHMLFDEASLASRVRHPHVVEIMDLGDEQGIPFIVMEWIDGEPLHLVIKAAAKAGGIPLPVATRIVSQACAGLHAAHELRDDAGHLVGLVHRDVSPQNVLVTWEGVAKVVDFGVAKAVGRASEDTRAGQVKGKIGYLAPEQARGGTVDRRTDVFALGILLFMLTTGKHPYRGTTEFKTLGALCSKEPLPRAGKVVAGFPATLEKVIAQALEKDPDRRYQTANDMLRELDHALPGKQRISTDEDVAAFIRPLLGQRFEVRRARLKEAQRIADERAAGSGPRSSFTTEAVDMMLEARGSVSGVQPVDDGERAAEDLLGAGLSPVERAAAVRAVAGIVQRLRRGHPNSSGVVIAPAPSPTPASKEVAEEKPALPETVPAAEAAAPVDAPSGDEPAVSAEQDAPPAEASPRKTVGSLGAFSLPRVLRDRSSPAKWLLAGAAGVAIAAVVAVVASGRREAAPAPSAVASALPPAVSTPLQAEAPDAGAAPSSSELPLTGSVPPEAGAPREAAPDVARPKGRKPRFIPKGI